MGKDAEMVVDIPEGEEELGRNNSYSFQDDNFIAKLKSEQEARSDGNAGDGNAGGGMDPPTKLIGNFIQRQQESGSVLLDPSMGELTFWANASDREFPSTIPEEREQEQQQQQQQPPQPQQNPSREGLRSRRLVYGRASSKSRLMEPPPPPRSSEMLRRSGMMSGDRASAQPLEDEDPLGDVPEHYDRFRWSWGAVLQFVALLAMVAALVATSKVESLASKKALGLQLWRWAVMALVVLCGRLLSGWIIRVLVFLIERNFLLRKRLLYFVYGLQGGVKNCLWFGITLAAWRFIFNPKIHLPTQQERRALDTVSRILICLLVAASLWLLKILLVKVLALNFHVNTYFERIQESLFNQYILETLSGPALVDPTAEEKALAGLVEKGKIKLPGEPKPPPSAARKTGIGNVGGGGGLPPGGASGGVSVSGEAGGGGGIKISHLQRLNQKNVSAWSMKRLIRIVRSTGVTSLAAQSDGSNSDGEDREIGSEWQAKSAAKRIFRNVAPSGKVSFLTLGDMCRYLEEDEAIKAFALFDGAQESGKITKQALISWVVNVYRERRALSFSLNDTKTAVKKLHRIIDVIMSVIILIISLLILGIATTHLLVVISSQLVLIAFVFGNTCKTVFEAIIFLFAMHPFDVGDRCVVDGVQMIVEEMNILNTVFLRYDNEKIYYPNSVLATKPISNFYRSPDMGDAIDFSIHVATPNEKIEALKQRLAKYIEEHLHHWYPTHHVVMKEIEDMNRIRMALWLQHTMNHQDAGEKWIRRSHLIYYLKGVFQELGIDYKLLPQEVHLRQLDSA